MTAEAENIRICERLLGWRVSVGVVPVHVIRPENEGQCGCAERPPRFDDWEDAGLILDTLERREIAFSVHHNGSIGHGATFQKGHIVASRSGTTGPLAVRATALQWLHFLP